MLDIRRGGPQTAGVDQSSGGVLTSLLLRFWSNAITVHISAEAFTFSSDHARLLVPTFLYLRDGNDGVRVVSVGEEPAEGSSSIVRVDLFRGATRVGKGRTRIGNMECLEAYVRFAIFKVVGRTALVRPAVTIVGAESLDRILHGFQTTVLRQVFESAGAHTVTFADAA